MADRLLFVVYIVGLCTGAVVAIYGLAIFLDAKSGGRLLGAAGLLIGSVTIAASWAHISGWPKKRQKS